MAYFQPERRLTAKALPRSQATTVLALKSLRAEDDANIVKIVCELASWGMRPTLVLKLVGDAGRKIVKAFCEKAQGKLTMGRLPVSIGEVLAKPMTHLQASIFLRKFISYFRMEGGEPAMQYEAFINAYRDYRAAIMWKTGKAPLLTPENAFLLTQKYLDTEAKLSPCPTCGVHFVQSSIAIRVGSSNSRGACPSIRLGGH